MKKSVINETHRIMDLMGRVVLTELNQRYLDQLLDKINDSGMESLSDYEKMALEKLSNDEDVEAPEIHSLDQTEETLRFTPVVENKPMVRPSDMGQLIGKPGLPDAKLDDDIVSMIESTHKTFTSEPIFIDGYLDELDKPEQEQQIRMILPNGEYECVASLTDNLYTIRLKEDSDFDDEMDVFGLTEDMTEYKVFDSGEMNEPLDMAEGNAFVGAAKKAQEEGKDTFELDGKTYRVTMEKTNMTQGFV